MGNYSQDSLGGCPDRLRTAAVPGKRKGRSPYKGPAPVIVGALAPYHLLYGRHFPLESAYRFEEH
jgi:hypothetical protein